MARSTASAPKRLSLPALVRRPDAVMAQFLAGAEAWAETIEVTDLPAESGFFFLAERRGAAGRGEWETR